MPELYPIPSQGFPGLISDMGIQLVPRAPLWWLSDVVQPVALINSQVALQTISTDGPGALATAGEVTPVGNDVLADTGAHPTGVLGKYRVWIAGIATGTANRVILRRRNAADSGDIWNLSMYFASGQAHQFGFEFTERILESERYRINVVNGDATAAFSAGIFGTELG